MPSLEPLTETFDRATLEFGLSFSIGLLESFLLLGAALQFDLGSPDFGPDYAAYLTGLGFSALLGLSIAITLVRYGLRRRRGVGEVPPGARIRTTSQTVRGFLTGEPLRFVPILICVVLGGTFVAGMFGGIQLAGLAFVVLLRREEGIQRVRFFESANRNLWGGVRSRRRGDARIWTASAGPSGG